MNKSYLKRGIMKKIEPCNQFDKDVKGSWTIGYVAFEWLGR